MRTLDRPTHSARATFTTCISRVRSVELKARLEAATETIVAASDAFDQAAARHALHDIVRTAGVGPAVTGEEMEKVYTHRMAKKGAPGRDIYDELFSSAPQGICPLCVQRSVATLDHHLPKARYPALAVAPLNLVPCCTDCNKAKLVDVPRAATDVALHPYYDDLGDHPWLSAEVVELSPSAVLFSVDPPEAWSDTLATRVKAHFSTMGLAVLYASQAAGELINVRGQFAGILDAVGVDGLRNEIETRAASCERGQPNGWRAATYRAWAESEWFCAGGFEA